MKIALLGYGKMGKEIEQMALSKGYQISLRADAHTPINVHDLATADVAIEFTQPDAAVKNIRVCFDAKVPVVVGTTGWYDELKIISIECEAKNQSLLYASNFSIGVNILFELNRKLALMMNQQNEYDVEIVETHHTQKADMPSGTAITLANDIIKELKRKTAWSLTPETEQQLLIRSLRQGDVKGEHIIEYHSENDTIELKHTAHNRKGFAQGALLAAAWLIGKQGVFTMKDVLFGQ